MPPRGRSSTDRLSRTDNIACIIARANLVCMSAILCRRSQLYRKRNRIQQYSMEIIQHDKRYGVQSTIRRYDALARVKCGVRFSMNLPDGALRIGDVHPAAPFLHLPLLDPNDACIIDFFCYFDR